ncbi:MAG: DUF3224 domain-containing protein [Candidatus Eisenbacteria bacterium]|uniref:DUF3224 domain-containing protein n=1 Tax=Eiseniibacteriota bacterium TaxID=2212470 RepID=A0A933SD61_UNCEI|nr:DUF3224 domain-containing protein [Candidatus Eisenbacteria bacterium]
MNRSTGPFDVKMTPQESDPAEGGVTLARLALEKRYHGALEADAIGTMISATTLVKGSAAYSAIERVTGTLEGREGSFVLQHTGVMERGTPSLRITVVPDSGTGALAGLTGTLEIVIEAGRHSYVFNWDLPA